MFSTLCQLLRHAEIKSYAFVDLLLSRIYELREAIRTSLTSEESELTDIISNGSWFNEFVFLVDIYQSLNFFDENMQRNNENFLTFADKVNYFKE